MGAGRGAVAPPRVRFNALRGDLPDLVTPPGYIGVRVSKIGGITSAEVTRDGVAWVPIHGIPADLARHRQEVILQRLGHRGVLEAQLPPQIENPVTVDQVNAHYHAFRWGFTPQRPPQGAEDTWAPHLLAQNVLTEEGQQAQTLAVHNRNWLFFREWEIPLAFAGHAGAEPEAEEEEIFFEQPPPGA